MYVKNRACHMIFGLPQYSDPPVQILLKYFGPPLKYMDPHTNNAKVWSPDLDQ